MEHSYVGKDSDYHKRIKAVLKWGSDENWNYNRWNYLQSGRCFGV
jgi:hypothetical protein